MNQRTPKDHPIGEWGHLHQGYDYDVVSIYTIAHTSIAVTPKMTTEEIHHQMFKELGGFNPPVEPHSCNT